MEQRGQNPISRGTTHKHCFCVLRDKVASQPFALGHQDNGQSLGVSQAPQVPAKGPNNNHKCTLTFANPPKSSSRQTAQHAKGQLASERESAVADSGLLSPLSHTAPERPALSGAGSPAVIWVLPRLQTELPGCGKLKPMPYGAH